MSDAVPTPEELAPVAEAAAGRAASYLRERFRDGDLAAEYTPTDVKTEADIGAEERILERIRAAYPDHPIAAEESGEHPGEGPVRWVVDPLDGTNNFAIGSPVFAVGVTAIGRATASDGTDEPLATAVHVPVLSDSYVATRDGGATYNGTATRVGDGDAVPADSATVCVVIGTPVLESTALQDRHAALSDAVGAEVKRVIQTWAPLVYWGLLARGRLDGFVCFHPDEREQAPGALLAREAGCVERADGPLSVFATTEATAATLWDAARDAR